MEKYVDLQTKGDKTDEDINNLEDNKTQLDKMNNTSHNLSLQAGVSDSDGPVNMERLINMHKKKLENKYIEAFIGEDGQMIREESNKRETIKVRVERTHQKIDMDEEEQVTFLEPTNLHEGNLSSIDGEIIIEEVKQAIL